MKLSELKAGMIIESRRGIKYLLVEIKEELIGISSTGWFDLSGLTEDMIDTKDSIWTIDKVYNIICPASLSSLLSYPIGRLIEIWNRNER